MSGVSGAMRVVVSIEATIGNCEVERKGFLAGLEQRVSWAVGDGLLCGSAPVEVETWGVEITVADATASKVVTEPALRDWLGQQQESGAMKLEDVPRLMARYALSSPDEMIEELAERMGPQEARGM